MPSGHAKHDSLPSTELWPLGQSSHASDPDVSANVPGRHGLQVASFTAPRTALEVPTGQT